MAGISTNKLGQVGNIPIVPMPPVAAQIGAGGYLHLKLEGSDMYVSGKAPNVPPSQVKSLMAALKTAEQEPSWSGSGRTYVKLTVAVDTDKLNGQLYGLYLGTFRVGSVLVDPTVEIVSSDESIESQIANGPEDDGPGEEDG